MPQFLIDFANWLYDLVQSVMLTLFDLLGDILIFAFDLFMGLSVTILDGMGDMFSALDITGYISQIPPETGWVLQQIGIGEAMGIILAAIPIRILLQLIPFTRLGS